MKNKTLKEKVKKLIEESKKKLIKIYGDFLKSKESMGSVLSDEEIAYYIYSNRSKKTHKRKNKNGNMGRIIQRTKR